MGETELLEKFRKGDVHAFEQVFKSAYPFLKAEVLLLLNDENEAEDQVQQLFIDIWNKALYRTIDTSLRAYLRTAIRNKCFNFLEKRKNYQRLVNNYAATISLMQEQDKDETGGMPVYMHRALQELPPQRLTAFNLVYLEEKSYKMAAGEMGISVNSLKTHLKIGLKSLRSAVRRV